MDNPESFDLDSHEDALTEWISARHVRLTGRAGEVLAQYPV